MRPVDVRKLLVPHWERHKRFLGWTEILEEYTDQALREHNSTHRSASDMTPDQIRKAVQRVAAAAILSRQSLITLPTTASSHAGAALDSTRLLGDLLNEHQIGRLLTCSLFVPRGATAVRFLEGELAAFLAAKWLSERVGRGFSEEELLDELLVKVEADLEKQLPESRSGMVGWLASFVPACRSRLIRRFPYAILHQGDPSRLPGSEIVAGLKALLATRDSTERWPTRPTLRRLARPEIEPGLVALLESERSSPAACDLLPPYVELGRYRSGVSVSLEIARDTTLPSAIRGDAIRAVGAAGDENERRQLLDLVDTKSRAMRRALFDALVPDVLVGDLLVRFLVIHSDDDDHFFLSLDEPFRLGARDERGASCSSPGGLHCGPENALDGPIQ
jgi:hypothetical protein